MKRAIFLFLFLIMMFPLVSSIDINMNSKIPKGSTIIASVSGNFFDPITKENIYFYRGHVLTSFDYDVARIDEDYYIYVQTVNKAENNYSINISGVRYLVGSQVSSEQISKSFSIINETADFLVNPGFVVTDGNFSIRVQNLQPTPITIELETEVNSGSSSGFFDFLFGSQDVEQSITLNSGEIKNLYIQLKDISETTIRTITLRTGNTIYFVPCYVILTDVPIIPPEENETAIPEENITIINNGTNETNTDEVNLIDEEGCSFFSIIFGTCKTNPVQNETYENNSQTNQTSNKTFPVADYEVVKVGNKTVAIKDGKVLNESATSKTCAQIKGDVCSSGEICQNTTIYAKDAKCCISSCVKEEVKSNNKIIGWVIIGVLFIIILRFFVEKFNKTKRKDDPLLNPRR